jgi:hypothetical protein
MNSGDKLIIAGVVTVPLVLAVAYGEPGWPGVIFSASVALAAGLIATGVLIGKIAVKSFQPAFPFPVPLETESGRKHPSSSIADAREDVRVWKKTGQRTRR